MIHKLVLVFTCLFLFATQTSLAQLDVDAIFVSAVEDREQDVNLQYVFIVSVIGTDMAGGRVFRPGNPTPVCTFDPPGPSDEMSCEVFGTSLNDFCTQFGFGDFDIEIDAAAGMNDAVTVFFDPGCVDPFVGNMDVTSPAPGQDISPNPGPTDFCWSCENCTNTFRAEFDDFGELIRDSPMTRCWDPGVCLRPGMNQEFRPTSVQFYSDFVPTLTDNDDDFVYVSFFQNANSEFFDVVDPAPTTPPSVPSGIGGSFPVFVDKLVDDGSSLTMIWDVDACCGVTDHHLVYGTGADLPSTSGGAFALDGSECGLGSTGDFDWAGVPSPPAGDFLWWLILANDGSTTEGSWGEDGADSERNGPAAGGVSGQCGMTASSLTNTCGR